MLYKKYEKNVNIESQPKKCYIKNLNFKYYDKTFQKSRTLTKFRS